MGQTTASWAAGWGRRWSAWRDGLREKHPRAADGLARTLRRPFWLTVLTAQGIRRNDLAFQAAGLAFWLLLSLIPFLALVFAILKAFGLLELTRPFLLQSLAAGHVGLVDLITRYVEAAQAATLGGAGVLTLLAVGFTVLQRVKKTLNAVWRVENPPGYGHRLIEYLAVLSVTPFLVLLPVGVSAVLNSPQIQSATRSWTVLASLKATTLAHSGFLIYGLVLFYAYAFLPDARVRWRHALLGAVVAGSLLQVAQRFYILAMFQVTNYNMIYGALALLPFLMVWLFLGMVVFLFGAELSHASQHYRTLLGTRRMARQSATSRAILALGLLLSLLSEFRRGAAPVEVVALARRLDLPLGMVEGMAERLRAAGLITPVADAPGRLVPARPAERVTVRDVLRRLEVLPVFPEQDAPATPEARDVLGALFRRANRALEGALTDVTLAELLVRAERPEET